MAKFCKYCGKPLEDGQVCDCAASQAAAQPAEAPEVAAPAAATDAAASTPAPATDMTAPTAAPAPAAAPTPAPAQPSFNTEKAAAVAKAAGEKAKSALTLWAKSLLTYLKTPHQGVTEALNDPKNLVLAGIYAGVNALAAFFFLWAMMGKVIEPLSIIGLSSIAKVGLPILILLLAGIIFAVVFISMSGLALFASAKLNKRELDIKQAMVIASVSSTYPTILLLVGTLLGLLNFWLGMICLILAALVWAINACTDLYDYAGLNGTRSIKEMGIMLGMMAVVLLVCYLVTRGMLGWAISEVTINGTKLGNIGELIGDLGNLFG